MQQALIVDDSKTARVSLRKMLEKHQIASKLVECAEDALEYLKENQPTMIFMDHMMPGMDGFEAVKVIKADPSKASIPIVMYTTQKGDMYVGQARALGAADLLPKPPNSKAVAEVLGRIKKVISDNEMASTSVNETVPPVTVAPVIDINESENKLLQQRERELTLKHERERELALKRELELQRELDLERKRSSEFKTVAEQARANAVAASAETAKPEEIVPASDHWLEQSYFGIPARQCAMILGSGLFAVIFFIMYLSANSHRNQLMDERVALYKSVEWAVNESESYDYGEDPFAGKRLKVLTGLVSRLSAIDFKGTIRLEGHTGDFCVTEVALKGGDFVNMLPSAKLALSKCKNIGVSAEKAVELSGRQSDEFKEFLKTSPLLQSSDISIEIVRYGSSEPKYEYPEIVKRTKVGDWNTVALKNNRVNFILLPRE